ncbi:extracellular solute-binding protein [Candidatus Microgenomates bacterium]|nr:extracellular solute-binding protein [Candidatus Microgenomates bacterium]
MKVPLAGTHQEIFSKEQVKQEPLSGSSGETAPAPVLPKGEIVPPPPSFDFESPSLISRIFPFLLGLIALVVLIIVATQIVPRFLAGGGGPVSLTYWGLWEDENIMKVVIADFERENPNIKINYQKQDIKQYRETLTNRLSQKEGPASPQGGPDIFRFHNTWVPMLKTYLLSIPANIYTNGDFEKTFYPVAQKDLKMGNNYIGIPLEIDTLALFINDDDFKAAGLSPPATWDELRTAARQLTVRDSSGRIVKSGVALGTFDNIDASSDILALMMIQNGVDFRKVDKSISRDGRNLGEDTLAYYVSFAQGENRIWDDTLDVSTPAFAKEKLSMYFGYSWRVFEIQALNPNLRFSIHPAPQLSGESKTFASYWVEGVSKNSSHPKEAFLFLKFLSKPETLQKLFSEGSKLRLFGEPYSRLDLADNLKSNQYAAPFLAKAKDAASWYLASNTYDNGLNDQMRKYFQDAVNGVLRGISPGTALETAAKGIEVVATQYGL